MFQRSKIKSSMHRFSDRNRLYEQDNLLCEYEIMQIQGKRHNMLISQGHLAYFLDSLLAYCFVNIKVAVTAHVSSIIVFFLLYLTEL